jgi:hypothetical protein
VPGGDSSAGVAAVCGVDITCYGRLAAVWAGPSPAMTGIVKGHTTD